MAGAQAPKGQLQVLLRLRDGERSFGMSLAQRSPAVGPKYTVVSSVFANSPADRAGVRKGYVVRRINDKPMNGLTVAQVANHFRNESQAKITLEVLESMVSPRNSAFAAAATFGGVSTLPNRSATQAAAGATSNQRPPAPVTGFSAASTGRAIAAPGTALAVPSVAAPKQPVLRLGAKPAAKSLAASQPQTRSIPAGSPSAAVVNANSGAATPVADAKVASGARHAGLRSKAVTPVLRLGPQPKAAPPAGAAAQKSSTASAKQVELKPAAKSVPVAPTLPAAEPTSSRIPRSPVQAIESSTSAQVTQEQKKPATTSVPVLPTPSAAPTLAAKTVASTSAPTSPAKKTMASAALPLKAPPIPAALATSQGSAASSSLKSSSVQIPTTASTNGVTNPQRIPATSATQQQVSTVSVSGAGSARAATSPQTVVAPKISQVQAQQTLAPAAVSTSSVPQTPAVIAQNDLPVSARSMPPPPVAIQPRPQSEHAKRNNSSSVRSPARATTAVQPVPTPTVPPAASTPAVTKTKTGKKRGRPRRNAAATNGTTNSKGKAKAKKSPKHCQGSDEVDSVIDDEDVFALHAFSSDSDLEESPSKKTARRAAKGRRRGVAERPRHSLTVDRLVGMGFTQEDAEASVKEIGDDPDACMVWIISKIEERQFTEDLNRASIQSEQSKRDEEKRVKKLERETLVHAKKFMTLFPTSYLVCPESTATRLRMILQSTIDQVSAETYLREVLTKLLTLEGKSIRWYQGAVRSYMLELAGRLEVALGSHDIMACCARVSASDATSDGSCTFVRKIIDEVKALTKALFEMPTNQGGVPPVFLECDETTKFDLEDDGFEVIE